MTKNHSKGERIGRTPKTGTELTISPRDRKPPPAIPKQRIDGRCPSGVVGAAAMVWIYWDTFWSLFFSAIWFMTIISHPDAQITDT